MLAAGVRKAAAAQILAAAPATQAASQQLVHQLRGNATASAAAAACCAVRCITSTSGPTSSSSSSGGSDVLSHSHVFDETNSIVGAYTPITKRLWAQRYQWTAEQLAAAAPRDPSAAPLAKPPHPMTVTYPFSSDPVLREHYRNPWNEVRIGRILEDLDSLAGFTAFEHCDDGDPSTRPPLLVTASVETIELRGSRISLEDDMEMSGRVVWTGSSSMDIRMALVQAGQLQLSALFTFVSRDALSGKAHPVPQVAPQSQQDKDLFEERRQVNEARKAARKAASGKLHDVSHEGERWARQLMAAAKTKRDMPALADSHSIFMDDVTLSNAFTCQPAQRNMHGRIFGGFLMRRAFELAHSTAYLFAGCRPRTVEVDQITFQRPVNVADLLRFRACVLRAWPSQLTPGKGVVHVQVEASVTQPEKLQSEVTNTFGFRFVYELRHDAFGNYVLPRAVLPSTEQQALEVAAKFGPGTPAAAAAPGQ